MSLISCLRMVLLGVTASVALCPLADERVAYGEESVARGRVLYQLHCTECHGTDGRARIDVIANATDLTEPDLYLGGSTPEDIHRSIHDGAGVAMPAWRDQLGSGEDVWHLVNFVLSLWPEERRPSGSE